MPVFLVGGSSFVLPRKVVAAVEVPDVESTDNELNDRIIKQACSLAMQCNAELHLLYACDISAALLADMGGPVTVSSEFANEHNVDVIVMGRVQSHGVDKSCCVLAVWILSVPDLIQTVS